MKLHKLGVIAVIVTGMAAATTQAQSVTTNSNQTVDTTANSNMYELYRANEWSADAFMLGSLRERGLTGGRRDRFGLGIGGNYYITRFLGVGSEIHDENTTGPFIDNFTVNALGRWPLGDTGFAPYVFAGIGHQFDPVQQTIGQFGVGAEYRLSPRLGFFSDVRHIIPDRTDDYGMIRAGVRLSF
jgi:hypothetical protein